MLNFFKTKNQDLTQKTQSLSLDSISIQSNSQNINYQKNLGEKSENILEIRIISSDDDFQEIEITYGNKKKRKIIKKSLPKNLTSDYFYSPSINVGATNLKSLSLPQKDDFLFKEKLLHALAKLNFLAKNSAINQEIDYKKIWDGDSRIAIDAKFSALSLDQKQQAFDLENTRRSDFLNTSEKAILVAIINNTRAQNKIDRDIISETFAEISDKNSFKNFITDLLQIASSKETLFNNFAMPALENAGLAKKETVANHLVEIVNDPNSANRQAKIKTLKIIIAQELRDERTK